MLSPFWFPLQKPPIPSPLPLLTNPHTPASLSQYSPTLGHWAFSGPRASPPFDVQQGHPLLPMCMELVHKVYSYFLWFFCLFVFLFVCLFLLHIIIIYISSVFPFPGHPPLKSHNSSLLPLFPNQPSPTSLSWYSPTLLHLAFPGPRASPPFDVQQVHPLLPMRLEPWETPCVLFGWWFCPWELWEYLLIHIVVPPMVLQTPSAPWVLSVVPPLGTVVIEDVISSSFLLQPPLLSLAAVPPCHDGLYSSVTVSQGNTLL